MKRRLVLAAIAALGAACATVAGLDDLAIGECKGGLCDSDSGIDEDGGIEQEDAKTDVNVLLEAGPCPSGKGPTSIRVGPPENSFCVDATEVTNAQYNQFVAAAVDPKTQPPECGWNTSFAALPIDGGADLPVVGVDWCDAHAFCKWAGKYLCGKAVDSKKTGAVTDGERNDPKSSQWFVACSQGGALRYPYGTIHRPTACNTKELDAGKALPAGSNKDCSGGYPGVFDMIGNVWEWYDGPCRPDGGLEVDGGDGGPQSNECFLRGGSFINVGDTVDCQVNGVRSRRDARETYLGFRCCAD